MKLVYSTVRVPKPSAKQALPAAAAASGFRRSPAGPPRCSATERKQCPITHVQAAPGCRARSRSTAPAGAEERRGGGAAAAAARGRSGAGGAAVALLVPRGARQEQTRAQLPGRKAPPVREAHAVGRTAAAAAGPQPARGEGDWHATGYDRL